MDTEHFKLIMLSVLSINPIDTQRLLCYIIVLPKLTSQRCPITENTPLFGVFFFFTRRRGGPSSNQNRGVPTPHRGPLSLLTPKKAAGKKWCPASRARQVFRRLRNLSVGFARTDFKQPFRRLPKKLLRRRRLEGLNVNIMPVSRA